jgi:hypothetical protein
MGTLSSYETALQPFNPDQNLTNAGIQMKQLLDTLPQVTRVNVMKLTVSCVLHTHWLQVASPSSSTTVLPYIFDPISNETEESQG